jgi:hypothetical protein
VESRLARRAPALVTDRRAAACRRAVATIVRAARRLGADTTTMRKAGAFALVADSRDTALLEIYAAP